MRGKGIEFYMKLQNEMRKERSNLMEVVRKEGLIWKWECEEENSTHVLTKLC
jgi:hypothetical protein